MAWQRTMRATLAGLAMVMGACLGGASAAERTAPPPGLRGGPELRRPVAPPTGQPGESLPAVREEMQRYRQALKDVFAASLSLAREADNALRQLRENGADEAELQAAAKALAPQARELAEKQAAALATHYENLAKIFKPADEAARKQLLDALAEETLRRISSAAPFPPFLPGRPEIGPREGVMPPRGRTEAPGPDRIETPRGRDVAPRETPARRPGTDDKGDAPRRPDPQGGRDPAPRDNPGRRPEPDDPGNPPRPANF